MSYSRMTTTEAIEFTKTRQEIGKTLPGLSHLDSMDSRGFNSHQISIHLSTFGKWWDRDLHHG